MKPLPTHGRYGHSAITARPRFQWPNQSRLAVYFALGIEHYAFGEGMTENLVSGNPHPDVLNTSWREYGNRVGAWRVLQYFADAGVPLSILLNSAVCEQAPDLIEAARRAEHEFIAHGYSNSDTLAGMAEPAERAYLNSVACASAATPTCSTGAWMISRCGSRPAPVDSSRFPILRRSTTVRPSSAASSAPPISPT